MPWTYAMSDLTGEEIVETFYKKELPKKKKNQKEFRAEKLQREKVISYMLNEKDIIIHLIAGQIKKTQYK